MSLTADTLTLRMTRGAGEVRIALSTITEAQLRSSPGGDWRDVDWPPAELDRFRTTIGLSADGSSKSEIASSEPAIVYVEEDGTEVLSLLPGFQRPFKMNYGRSLACSQTLRISNLRNMSDSKMGATLFA